MTFIFHQPLKAVKLKATYIFIICLLLSTRSMAQVAILKMAIQKIDQYHNLSYSQTNRQKNPFTGDWTSLSVKTMVSRDKGGPASTLYYMQEGRGYHYIYNGTAKIELDLNNKTYTIKTEPGMEPYQTPFYWASFIQDHLNKMPEKIRSMPDTLIGNTLSYHIRIMALDSGTSKQIHDLYLDKKTYLPCYVKQFLQGRFGKGDMIDDNIAVMINEMTYKNYVINDKNFKNIKDLTIPADFQPETKLTMLSTGDTAPDWQLPDLNGKTLSNRHLKGQVILLDFSFNACAACTVSNPALNRLHEKYKNDNVRIVTINISDPRQSILAYSKKYKIDHKVLLNGRAVAKSFRVSAYPSFYVIDKNGLIAATFEGFGEDTESKLINKIDGLK